MLTVVDYELIRRKHYVDGLSVRSIAKELGYSRKAVTKALRHPSTPAMTALTDSARMSVSRCRLERSIRGSTSSEKHSTNLKRHVTTIQTSVRIRSWHRLTKIIRC